MSSFIDYLQAEYDLRPGICEAQIETFLAQKVIPDIKSYIEDSGSIDLGFPLQAMSNPTSGHAYFDFDAVLDYFYDFPVDIDNMPKYELANGRIYFEADTDNEGYDATRYLAWKLFVEFGVGDSFESTTISEDKHSIGAYKVNVTRDGRGIPA